MKFKVAVFAIGILIMQSIYSENIDNNPVGWHWYNETPVKKEKKDNKKNILYKEFSQLRPSQQLKILQHATTELRDKAILTGNVNDIANYKRAQDLWVSKATAFTVGWQRMLLEHPELNYSLQYSHENALAPVMQQHEHDLQNEAISNLAKNNGLLVFYRADKKPDQLFATLMQSFSKNYHISVMFVSENDNKNSSNTNVRVDENFEHAHALGVNYFPAVLLVNPRLGNYQVVSYGYHSQDELASRLLSISDNWKPNF